MLNDDILLGFYLVFLCGHLVETWDFVPYDGTDLTVISQSFKIVDTLLIQQQYLAQRLWLYMQIQNLYTTSNISQHSHHLSRSW